MVPTSFFLFVLLFFHKAYSHPTERLLSKRGMKFERLRSVELMGKEYEVELLPSADQGKFSDTYEIIKPFRNTGAILKVVSNDETANSEAMIDIALEVRFLIKRSLLLYHQKSKDIPGAYYIVVCDMQKANPQYLPFYLWYIEDTNMDLAASLETIRTAVRDTLSKMALDDGLLYRDYHMNNVFFDRKLEQVLPIDWGPQTKQFSGVIELQEDKDSAEYNARVNKFIEELEGNILRRYSIKRLKQELKERGSKLRPQDEALAKAEKANANANGA